MRLRLMSCSAAVCLLMWPVVAHAGSSAPREHLGGWSVSFAPPTPSPAAPPPAPQLAVLPAGAMVGASAPGQQADGTPPPAFEYSDGYTTRRRVHIIASYATLPLFTAQYLLGQRLYSGSGGSGTRTAHAATAIGVGTLFGVNTVTGVWNLWEGRKDPVGRGRRLVHGLLMLAADAGFAATGLLAPGRDGGVSRSTHRTVAIASMSAATTSYLFMLLTR